MYAAARLHPIETLMEVFARIYSKNTGINIHFGSNFSTNGKDITIIRLLDDTNPAIRFEVEMGVMHEIGHIITGDYPFFQEYLEDNGKKKTTKSTIFNVVRDITIEGKTMETKFPGLKAKWKRFLGWLIERQNVTIATGNVSMFKMLVLAMYFRAREYQHKDKFGMGIILPEAAEEIYERRILPFIPDLAEHDTIQKSKELTEAIYEELMKEPPPPKPPPQPQTGEEDESESGESEDGQQSTEVDSNEDDPWKDEEEDESKTINAPDESEEDDSEEKDPDESEEDDSEEKDPNESEEDDSEEKDPNESEENDSEENDSEEKDPDESEENDSEEKDPDESEEDDSEEKDPDESEEDDSEEKDPDESEDEESESEGNSNKEGTEGEDESEEDSEASEGAENEDKEEDEEPLSEDGEEALKKIQEEMKEDEGETDIGEEIADDVNQYADNTCLYRESTIAERIIRATPRPGWSAEVAKYETKGRKITGFIGTKLKMLFISSRAPVWHRNMRKGKLDCLNLWKAKLGSEEVCKQKTPSTLEDSAVSMVVDNSSSMNGLSGEITHSILTSLSSDMDKLRIPFEAIGFTTPWVQEDEVNALKGIRTQPININLMKTFEEPYRQVRHRFVWPLETIATAELPAIIFAANRLIQRRETKKIMFLLTDGHTETGCSVLNAAMHAATKEFIERMKRAGIKVVLIGILSNSVLEYDKDALILNNLDEFARSFYVKLMSLLL